MQRFIDSVLNEGLSQGVFGAAAVAVGVREQVLARSYAGGAPTPDGQPVNAHTRFDMASCTKILAPTMVALRAMEAGKLSLDERVGDFFDAPADKRGITIRMLMTHTGGFVPEIRLDQVIAEPREAVSCILAHPLAAAPGERAIYSCMGYILLGKILEKRLGAPLNELAKRLVFEPLGMTETGYCPHGAVCAATEVDPATGKPWIGVVHDENARFLGGVSGNAGVFMPLCDGERFCGMLAQMGRGLLQSDTMARAIENATADKELYRGLGFHLAGLPDSFFGGMPAQSFGHTGFTGTSMAVEPKTGFWALILTNRVYPTRANNDVRALRQRIHSVCYEKAAAM